MFIPSAQAHFSHGSLNQAGWGNTNSYDAVKRVKRISVITIPRESFKREEVSVSGFKKIMRKDSFQELARMKEDGDVITFYMKVNRNQRIIVI
jgi:hypothetical protein